MDFPDEEDFTFSFDHKDNEGEYAGEVLEKKVDSLGWKVTLIAIIIPCLIAVVGVLSYFSITRKVNEFQHTGSATVEEFAKGYDARLAGMQNNLTAQKEAVDKELAKIGQNAAAVKNIQNSLKDIQGGQNNNQAGIKNNQKTINSLTTDADKMTAALGNMQKEMEKLATAVGEANRQVLTLRHQLETVETRLAGLKDMTAQKPDTETVRGMLTQFQKNLMPSVEAATDTLKKDLKALESRVSGLERQLTISSPGARPVPPGKIVEENLK
jgi:chromosome segregation ATPase